LWKGTVLPAPLNWKSNNKIGVVLSTIAFITVFIPLIVVFFWKPDNPNATSLLIGYFIFIGISF
jgi:hypothetical protein